MYDVLRFLKFSILAANNAIDFFKLNLFSCLKYFSILVLLYNSSDNH